MDKDGTTGSESIGGRVKLVVKDGDRQIVLRGILEKVDEHSVQILTDEGNRVVVGKPAIVFLKEEEVAE